MLDEPIPDDRPFLLRGQTPQIMQAVYCKTSDTQIIERPPGPTHAPGQQDYRAAQPAVVNRLKDGSDI